MYFSGPLMAFRARDFYFVDPLKYISFFSLTLQNLVYFSGLTIGENPALKVITGPLKYTSLIH